MDTKRITPREKEVYEYLIWFVEKNGFQPSIAEMGIALGGVTPGAIYETVKSLSNKGLLELAGEPRAIRLKDVRFVREKKSGAV